LATYIYVADNSMAVTAAGTPNRSVCANALAEALRQAEHGANAQRTFRLRHTGNLQTQFAEARERLGMTIYYPEAVRGAGARARARVDLRGRALAHRVRRAPW
jgi:hypothetical protein